MGKSIAKNGCWLYIRLINQTSPENKGGNRARVFVGEGKALFEGGPGGISGTGHCNVFTVKFAVFWSKVSKTGAVVLPIFKFWTL